MRFTGAPSSALIWGSAEIREAPCDRKGVFITRCLDTNIIDIIIIVVQVCRVQCIMSSQRCSQRDLLDDLS